MYYRINTIPCHKPWRGGEQPDYTTNKAVFEAIRDSVDGLFTYQVPEAFSTVKEPEEFTAENEEEYYSDLEVEWEDFEEKYLISYSELSYPITILDECWLYRE